MFYSTQVLARKGPLGVVWLAAHMDSKLKKNSVFEANLVGSVESIMNPEVPLALRLSGQLLLGVVNIYKKKVLYLYEDCNDAMSKMQQAFKPGAPMLQNGGKAAPMQIYVHEDPDYGSLYHFDEEEFQSMTFDMSQPLDLGPSSKSTDKMWMVEEGAMFGTPLHNFDEQFENGEEELERFLSSSKERLRDAGTPQVQRLFDDASDASPRKGGGEFPEDAGMGFGDDFPAADFAPPPSAPPSSRHDSDAAPLGLTPADGEGLDPLVADDNLPFPALEVTDSGRKSDLVPRPSKLAAGEKRKRAVRDVDAKGQLAITISTGVLRSFLNDSSPLLRPRKKLTAAYLRNRQPRDELDVASYSKAAAQSWLLRPGTTEVMAPALYDVYLQRWGDAALAAKRSKNQAATPHQAAEEIGAAEPPQTDLQELGALALRGDGHAGEVADYPEEGFGFDTGMPDTFEGEGAPLVASTPFQATDDPAQSPLPSERRPGSSRKRSERGYETEEAEVGGAGSPSSQQEFTTRTQHVLKQVKSKLQGSSDASGKKQRLHGKAAEGVAFEELHAGGGRTEAARLFFELLVLQSRKKVILHQDEPYGTIGVTLPGAR